MNKVFYSVNGKKIGVYWRDRADQSVAAEIFKLKEYRRVEERIKQAISPVIDAGAHSGMFTLYARALNSKARIIALEPEPNNLALLKKHLAENKISKVKVVSGALAGQTGERYLKISADSHNHKLAATPPNLPLASLKLRRSGLERAATPLFSPLERGDGQPPLLTKEGLGEVAKEEKQQKVRAFSFNDLCQINKIKKVSLLKMDIEGVEYEVLESLKGGDWSKIEAIILEYHSAFAASFAEAPAAKEAPAGKRLSGPRELEKLFRENGFSVEIFPSKFDKSMGFIYAQNKRIK